MKYIPGSTFLNRTQRHRKYFKRGIPYSLKIIRTLPDSSSLKYVFTDQTTGDGTDIIFEDARQADKFLEQFLTK